jgi:hypothetical protein
MIRYAENTALPRLKICHDVPESTLRWSQNKSHISIKNSSPLKATNNMLLTNNWGPCGREGKGEGEIIFKIAGAI